MCYNGMNPAVTEYVLPTLPVFCEPGRVPCSRMRRLRGCSRRWTCFIELMNMANQVSAVMSDIENGDEYHDNLLLM